MRKIGEKNLSTELRICKGIRKAVLSAAMLSLLALTACSTGKAKTADSPVPGGDEQGGEIFIAAAASLKPVMEEVLIPGFTKSHPLFTVTGTYDSSGKLQKQIEEGLEADLFLSAATKQMDALNEKGLLDSASVTMLLENQIVLIVPEGSEDSYGSFTDIEKAAVIAIGDPDSVPAGQYAKEALTQTGLWDSRRKCRRGNRLCHRCCNHTAGKSNRPGSGRKLIGACPVPRRNSLRLRQPGRCRTFSGISEKQ